MYEFLTLAIAETNPLTGNFAVVTMEVKSKKIVKFDLKKEEIISSQGEVFWDIGFVTCVKDVIKDKCSKKLEVMGAVGITNRIRDLKSILEAKSANPNLFFDNENVEYAVVKVSNVIDIIMNLDNKNYKSEVFKSRLKVNLSGLPIYNNEKLILNKDYRWINYWKHIYQIDKFAQKKEQYIKLLKDKQKSLYLILHRMRFNNGSQYWIAGMHWL